MPEADAAGYGEAFDPSTWTEETRERVYQSDTFVTLGHSMCLQLDLGVHEEPPHGYRLPQPETTAECEAIALHIAFAREEGCDLTLVSKVSFESLTGEWEQRHQERDAAEEQAVAQPVTWWESLMQRFAGMRTHFGFIPDLAEGDCDKYLPYEAERNELLHTEAWEWDLEHNPAQLQEVPQTEQNKRELHPQLDIDL